MENVEPAGIADVGSARGGPHGASLAGIRVADDTDAEGLLNDIVRTLRADGHRLAGFTQCLLDDPDGQGPRLALVDVADGAQTLLSAPRALASPDAHRACTIDDSALAAALKHDVPALCVVRESHVDAWRAFGGDLVCCLEPDLGAVRAWSARHVTDRTGITGR